MHTLGLACLLALAPPAAASSSAPSSSAIDKGDFRLGLSGGLFSYTISTNRDEVAGVTTRTSVHRWGLGFTGLGPETSGGMANLGWTAGYAITPSLEVGSHLSLIFGGGKVTTVVDGMSADAQNARTLATWIQPYFHYNLQLSKPLVLVFEGAIGVLYGGYRIPDPMIDNRQRTVGPTFGPGVGINFFLTKNASMDLMFSYHYGAMQDRTTFDTVTTDGSNSMHQIMFRLGTSIWMGGGN